MPTEYGEIGFTTAAVVIAQTFVAMPFLVVALEGALRSVDARLERTAASLGASPSRVLATVTLPLVLPALAAGAYTVNWRVASPDGHRMTGSTTFIVR